MIAQNLIRLYLLLDGIVEDETGPPKLAKLRLKRFYHDKESEEVLKVCLRFVLQGVDLPHGMKEQTLRLCSFLLVIRCSDGKDPSQKQMQFSQAQAAAVLLSVKPTKSTTTTKMTMETFPSISLGMVQPLGEFSGTQLSQARRAPHGVCKVPKSSGIPHLRERQLAC